MMVRHVGDAYALPEGREALRAAITRHVSYARALACLAENVVVTAGAQQAFDLLARTRDAIVIEDDYDGEFRFNGRPLDALQTLGRNGSVFYVGTFSKSLFPALRLGFVVAPP